MRPILATPVLGADKGGILVRDGESTSSTQLPDRLSASDCHFWCCSLQH